MTIFDRLGQIAYLSQIACSWNKMYYQSYKQDKIEAAQEVFQRAQRIVALIEEIQNHSELTEGNKLFLQTQTELMAQFFDDYSWVVNY